MSRGVFIIISGYLMLVSQALYPAVVVSSDPYRFPQVAIVEMADTTSALQFADLVMEAVKIYPIYVGQNPTSANNIYAIQIDITSFGNLVKELPNMQFISWVNFALDPDNNPTIGKDAIGEFNISVYSSDLDNLINEWKQFNVIPGDRWGSYVNLTSNLQKMNRLTKWCIDHNAAASFDLTSPSRTDQSSYSHYVSHMGLSDLVFVSGGANALRTASPSRPALTGQNVIAHVIDQALPRNHSEYASTLFPDDSLFYDQTRGSLGRTPWAHSASVYGLLFSSSRGLLNSGHGIFTSIYESIGPALNARSLHARSRGANLETASEALLVGVTGYSNESALMDSRALAIGTPIVQAIGNGLSNNNYMPVAEGLSKNVITVGALNHHCAEATDYNLHAWAAGVVPLPACASGPNYSNGSGSFWNHQQETDAYWRIKPEIVSYRSGVDAPSVPTSGFNESTVATAPLTYVDTGFRGSSASTAIVAGHVGLILDLWKQGGILEIKGSLPVLPYLSGSAAKAILVNTARALPLENISRKKGGWGEPDLARLNSLVQTKKFWVLNETSEVSQGGLQTFKLKVQAREKLRVTLAYADPVPQSINATTQVNPLVNDLDLFVMGPRLAVPPNTNRNLFLGNFGLMTQLTSAPFPGDSINLPIDSSDNINNLENVFIESASAGTWFVYVRGTKVKLDERQRFSLVVSGGILY